MHRHRNLTSKTNRKGQGQPIYYEYDALNRMEVKNRPADPNIEFSYDIAGRVVEVNDLRDVNDGGGITTYGYDRIGRVNDVNYADKWDVGYEYDKRGLRTKLTYPDGSCVTYEYDELSRLEAVKDQDGNDIARYEYDELSRRTLVTLGGNADVNAVYDYDIGNRLAKLTNNVNDVNIIFEYADYDKVGNRLSCKIDDANAHVYDYDNLYQLIFVDYNDGNSIDYYYDALGNRTEVNETGAVDIYDTNCLNQYTAVGPQGSQTSYLYDANGNLSDDGSYLYYYDCESRLTDVNAQDDTAIASYEYDYQGRRVIKTIHDSQTTIHYIYDGDQVIAEYDENDNLLRKFVYGPGIDEPICMIDVADGNTVYYYHFDGLGSVRAVSDANAAVVEKYSYDVFGEPTIRDANDQILTTSDCSNPYMFTGRRYDPESGLYYYRARYYLAKIGRFLQVDPIGYEAGLNLYAYVRNKPVIERDPYGLWTVERCAELWTSRRRRILIDLGSCVRSCPGILTVGIDVGLCIIACAPTARGGPWAIASCLAGCWGVSVGVVGACHVACARQKHLEVETARRARDFCMCRAMGCSLATCLAELE